MLGLESTRYDSIVWAIAASALMAAGLLVWLSHTISSVLIKRIHETRCTSSSTNTNPDSPHSSAGLDSIAGDWSALKKWIAKESPISHHSEDLFGRTALVRRLAQRLLLPFEQGVTIGLIGSYGSGKTSVIRLVQEEVASQRKIAALNVMFCNIDCWGFVDSGIALQYVLERVLEELSKHVDCLALNHLPESYRSLLAGSGGWCASLATFLKDSDPQAQLCRLTPILRAMNARLVLVVEELDRPQSSHFDPQDMEATLYRLKQVPGVSFILAGSKDAKYRIAFTKLCDHIEEI
ncbi:MAG: hypothetical protein GX621_11280 [Pirellulaceae bacterium]|nr:hypothetical protein [Pirellulaceae bacterium]